MSNDSVLSGFKIFLLVWAGQAVSLLGSGLTRFALGVWVYRATGSVTQFALISFFSFLPGILISPLAGVLVDRWSRRKVMIASDLGSGAMTLAAALLLWSGHLTTWHIYVLVAAAATFEAFQWPAYYAAMSLLVPEQQLGRANGLVQVAQSAADIAAPLLAGFLIITIDLEGIILIDCATFLVAVGVMMFVRFPELADAGAAAARGPSIWAQAAEGWRYITGRKGLLALLLLFALLNFSNSFGIVLITPMVLNFTSPESLGVILALGGAGMLVGSLVLTAWGGPKKRILGVLGFSFVFGIGMCIQGVHALVPVVAVGMFVSAFCLPIINGSSQVIWQTQVKPEVQGRVFSVRRMVAWSATPLGFFLAGPLSARVFEPAMAADGALASSLGALMGTGAGRGMALLIMTMGLVMIATAVAGTFYKALYDVESGG